MLAILPARRQRVCDAIGADPGGSDPLAGSVPDMASGMIRRRWPDNVGGAIVASDEEAKDDDMSVRDWLGCGGYLLLGGAAIFAFFLGLTYLGDFQQDLADRGQADAVLIGLVVAALLVGGTWWLLVEAGNPQIAMGLLTALIVWSAFGMYLTRNVANQMVSDYCAYGSVSKAQLEGCKDHVTAAMVKSRDTAASDFAQGDSTAECGYDSGPFCEAVLDRRYLDEAEPPPDPVGR